MLFWWALAAFVLTVLLANRWVINSTDARVFTNFALLPDNDVGIVLGTSAYTRDGKANPQFYARVDAAVQLYRLGKVKHLIVSGANPDSTYNEPRRMWQELTKAGVPPEGITMDFAGYRTFDSMARAKSVFGLQRFTVITQKYHAYRALFLGRKMGMTPVAFVAPIGATGEMGNRHPPREVAARVKAVLDLFVLRTKPRFLGQPEPLDIRSVPPADERGAPPPLPGQESA